jgi:hypothetical protein
MPRKELICYDVDRDVWTVDHGSHIYSLHCGECFDLAIGSAWFRCRLELDTNWYVILKGTKFTLHPRMAYAVRL